MNRAPPHGDSHDYQAQDTIYGVVPVGSMVMFWTDGGARPIPTGWLLCDGNNGTPNLVGNFPRGAASGAAEGAVGGVVSHGHTDNLGHDHNHDNANAMVHDKNHTGTAVTAHASTTTDDLPGSNLTNVTSTGHAVTQPDAHSDHAAHAHTAHSNHGAHAAVESRPPFIDVVFIMRVR